MPEVMKSAESDRISQLLLQTLKTERMLIQLTDPRTETDSKVANEVLITSFTQVVEGLSQQSVHIESSVMESVFRCAIRFLTRPSTTMKLTHLAIRCLRSCQSQSFEVLSGQNAIIVLGHLAGLLEQLKTTPSSGLDNMTEEVACETFGCIIDIIQVQKFGMGVEMKDVINAFLPQLIHSGLTFTSHSSKTLSFISIQYLLALLHAFDDFEEIWSSSFPGIFSAMFKVIQHGNNRSDRFLLENTIFLLHCLKLVCHRFMFFISETEEGKIMWKEQLLTAVSSTTTAPVTQLALWKWRVNLLQHMHIPLPVLLKSTMMSLSTVQNQVTLKHEINEFLITSAEFLGVELTGEILGLIADVHDGNDIVVKMKNKGIFFHRLQQTFHDQLTTSFQTLTTSSLLHNTSANDLKMTQMLIQILGFWGYLQLNDRRKAWVVINQQMIIDTFINLCIPSVENEMRSSRVVEMITCVDTLHHDEVSVVDVSYLDSTWPLAMHNKTCLHLLNILGLEFASEEYGIVSEIMLRAHDLLRRLTDKLLPSRRSTKSKKKSKSKQIDELTESFQRKKQKISTLTALIRLQTFFACQYVTIIPRPAVIIPNSTAPVCVLCGVSDSRLSRCSRCRTVWYCSREHQLQDWSAHRSQCIKPTPIPVEEKAKTANETPQQESKTKSKRQSKDLLSFRTNPDIILTHLQYQQEAEVRLENMISILSQSLDLYLHVVIDNSNRQNVLTPCLEQLTIVTLNSIADIPLLFGYELIINNGLFLQQLLFKVLMIMFASTVRMLSTVATTVLTRLALTLHPISIPYFIRNNLDYIIDYACTCFTTRLLVSPARIYMTLVGILKILSEANIADEEAVRLLRDVAMDGLEVLDESFTLGMYDNHDNHDSDEFASEESTTESDNKHAAAIAAVKMLAALPLVDPLPYASLASLLLKQERQDSIDDCMDIVKVWLTEAERSQLQIEITSQSHQASATESEDSENTVGRAILQSLIDFDQSLFALSSIHHDTADTQPTLTINSTNDTQQQEKISTSNKVSRRLLIDLVPRLALQLSRPARTLTLTTLDGLATILLRLHLPYLSQEGQVENKENGDEVHDILPQALHMVWETLMPRLSQLCHLYNKRIITKAIDKAALSHGSSGSVGNQKVVSRQKLEIGSDTEHGNSQKDALVLKLLQQTTTNTATTSPSKSLLIAVSSQSIPEPTQQLQQQRALFVLPRVWEFISLLSLLRPSFLQHKLLEDLWPSLLRSFQAVSLAFTLSSSQQAARMINGGSLDQQLALALLTITKRLVVMELCPSRAIGIIALLLQSILALSEQNEDSKVIKGYAQDLMSELLIRDPTISIHNSSSNTDSNKMHRALAVAYDLQQLQPRVRVSTMFSQPRYPSELQDDKLKQQLEVRQHAIMQRDVQASLLCLSVGSSNNHQLLLKGEADEAVEVRGNKMAAIDGKWMKEKLKRWSTAC